VTLSKQSFSIAVATDQCNWTYGHRSALQRVLSSWEPCTSDPCGGKVDI
jgi:hypothetical protein